jgi:hypothetical protein
MRSIRFALAALAAGFWATLALAGPALAEEAKKAPACDPCRPWWCQEPPPGCPCPTACLRDPLICIPCIDACVAKFQEGKKDSCFKLGAGAYHWWHYDNPTGDLTYGYPNGGEGTYFYYLNMDLDCPLRDCFFKSLGGHAQIRFRDDTVFRSFFDEQVWFYEGYGYLDTHGWGKLKFGAIWKRFGLDWDDSFWGNVAYYDGFKLDPDYGVSWEKTWNGGKVIEMDTFAQVFLEENEVNGSLAGADPESTAAFDEGTMAVLRAVPKWNLTANTSVALGLSGLFGTVEEQAGGDHSLTGWAVDLTFKWCDLKVYGELARTDGVQNPRHYVTGGPSDVYTDYLAGVSYTYGPVTGRFTWSHGDYENPDGDQDILLYGVTVKLTKYLSLYVEYVDWKVRNAAGAETVFEDGWQFVLNWDV